jgi:hypothetical protein
MECSTNSRANSARRHIATDHWSTLSYRSAGGPTGTSTNWSHRGTKTRRWHVFVTSNNTVAIHYDRRMGHFRSARVVQPPENEPSELPFIVSTPPLPPAAITQPDTTFAWRELVFSSPMILTIRLGYFLQSAICTRQHVRPPATELEPWACAVFSAQGSISDALSAPLSSVPDRPPGMEWCSGIS